MVEGIGDSEVPLTKEEIIEEPREFFPTFVEWAAENAQQITISSGTAGTKYTVPANKTLYITHAHASCATDAIGAAAVHISVKDAAGTNVYILAHASAAAAQSASSVSDDFTMPIKAESGQIIVVSVTNTASGNAGFVGFLLPKSISISQIR